ncbi:MAG: rubrerythrin [Clostridia bacterium]|nr:rubrerythrin [Clostridia bacterium]
MTNEQEKLLLKGQQGELDAALMYRALAAVAQDARDAAVFRRLAADEARHAKVFESLTQSVMIPKKKLSLLVPLLYRTLGRRRVYAVIADQEQDAAKNYEALAADFPAVKEVQADEARHANMVAALLDF